MVFFGCSRAEPQVTPTPVTATGHVMTSSPSSSPEVPLTSAGKETAIIAGGCFWGVEELLRTLPGVIASDVGYIGGDVANPTYSDVKTGRSGHAEAVRIIFDPAVLSYEKLLLQFFKIHDPTTKNRQGNDVGTQYRSAIFYQSPEQQKTALQVIARVNESGAWSSPVTTEVVGGGEYTLAEDYHQDYLQKHPNGYTCHFERDVKYY
jgi:peptide methionine sulfoxide reductase msrA/msrB